MIPLDAPRVHITAHIFFLGHFACEVEGFVYSLEDRPFPDVVTFDRGGGEEVYVLDPLLGKYGTAPEDAIAQALHAESKTVFTQHRLEDAFRDWHEGRREAAREHAGELRRVG
jgi:hypothetical protein